MPKIEHVVLENVKYSNGEIRIDLKIQSGEALDGFKELLNTQGRVVKVEITPTKVP